MKQKALVGLVVTIASGAASAPAVAQPSASFKISSTADAAASIPFSYQARGLRRHDRVVVQRRKGTAHVWRTVLRLPASTGRSSLPGLSLGQYQLRVAVLDSGSRLLAAQARRLAVFGNVPFATLFASSDRGLGSGVYTNASGTFPYEMGYYNGAVNFTAFTVTSNPCRSIHLRFVTAPPGQGEDISQQHGTATVVQESADPVSVTASGDSIGTIDAAVVPGRSWGLNLAQMERGSSDFLFTWYVNGSASCDGFDLMAHEPS